MEGLVGGLVLGAVVGMICGYAVKGLRAVRPATYICPSCRGRTICPACTPRRVTYPPAVGVRGVYHSPQPQHFYPPGSRPPYTNPG